MIRRKRSLRNERWIGYGQIGYLTSWFMRVVIVKEHLDRGVVLFQYPDIVYKANSCFAGDSCLHYDEEFRMWAVTNSALPWEQVHSAL